MSSAKAVTDATFEAEVVKAEQPVLVDFWAEWCQPCKMLSPIVEQVADEQAGKLTVAKVDVDENGDSAQRFGVMSIPTLILFKGGQPVERLVGYMPKDQLVRKLAPHL
jgi:thioredoxin 1